MQDGTCTVQTGFLETGHRSGCADDGCDANARGNHRVERWNMRDAAGICNTFLTNVAPNILRA